jgi:hypothetical protein
VVEVYARRTLPITYEIDRARKLIRTRCFGATSIAEVLEHFEELRAEPELPARVNVLLDLSSLVTAPERDQLRAIVAEMKDLGSGALSWGVLAIVAKTDLLFGMSRILGVFVEDSFSNTGVFRQLAEAERWIDAQLAAR